MTKAKCLHLTNAYQSEQIQSELEAGGVQEAGPIRVESRVITAKRHSQINQRELRPLKQINLLIKMTTVRVLPEHSRAASLKIHKQLGKKIKNKMISNRKLIEANGHKCVAFMKKER